MTKHTDAIDKDLDLDSNLSLEPGLDLEADVDAAESSGAAASSPRFDVEAELAQLDGESSSELDAELDALSLDDRLQAMLDESDQAAPNTTADELTVSEALLDEEFGQLMAEFAPEASPATDADTSQEILTEPEPQPAQAAPGETPQTTPAPEGDSLAEDPFDLSDSDELDALLEDPSALSINIGDDPDPLDAPAPEALDDPFEELDQQADTGLDLALPDFDLALEADQETDQLSDPQAPRTLDPGADPLADPDHAEDEFQDILMQSESESETDTQQMQAEVAESPDQSPADESVEGGDEFDRLLAEFESGNQELDADDAPADSVRDSAEGPAVETVTPAASLKQEPPELDLPDLDASAFAIPQLEQPAAQPAATAPTSPAASAQAAPQSSAATPQDAGGSKAPLLLGGLALLIAIGSAGFAYQQTTQPVSTSDHLEQRVTALEEVGGSAQLRQALRQQVERLEESLLQIQQQVRSESDQMEYSRIMMQQDLDNVQKQIDQLGSSLSQTTVQLQSFKQSLESQAATTQALQASLSNTATRATSRSTAAAPRPAADVAKPAAAKPAALSKDGGWTLNLVSFRKQEAASVWLDKVQSAGYPAELARISVKGQPWYRVRIGGLSHSTDARILQKEVAEKLGIRDAWISRR